MKILQIYNQRAVWGGEDFMVEQTIRILRDHGHEVDDWIVRNKDHINGLSGKVKAFISGIYSFSMKREMKLRLRNTRPDVVHAHNLYPLFSASVIAACKEENVPILIHCHNNFLTCPIGSHLRNNRLCELCTLGNVSPCVLHNCRGNILQSIGYALRSKVARIYGWFKKDPAHLIILSGFARKRLVKLGYENKKLSVLSNIVSIPPRKEIVLEGGYVIYAGRLSSEKGVPVLIEAARRLPEIPFCIAGDGPIIDTLKQNAPKNVHFEGWLDSTALSELYRKARFSVVPSICYETFGLAAADAMAHGLPVIASNLGALKEVIEDQKTGLLFESGAINDLADKIKTLWMDTDCAEKMGVASYDKANREFSEKIYLEKLLKIYASAITNIRKQ